jgi:hypothetical protein
MIYTKQGPENALHWDTLLLAVVGIVLNRILFTNDSFQNPENKFNKLYFKMSRM